MNRFVTVCALSVLVAACESRSPLGPSGGTPPPQGSVTYTVSGRVTNASGEPVEGARVAAVTQANCEQTPTYPGDQELPPCLMDHVLGADETDVDGAFSIANVPAGYIRLDVSHGSATVSEGVNVTGDATMSVVIP